MVAAVFTRWVRGGLNKRTVDFSSTSVWEQDDPLDLTLKLHNLVLSHLCLALFELLPQHWSSELVSFQQVSPCMGILRGMPGTPDVLFSFSHNIHWFAQEILDTSGTEILGREAWCGARTPWSHRGPLQLSYLSQILMARCECGTSLFCVFANSTILDVTSSVYS